MRIPSTGINPRLEAAGTASLSNAGAPDSLEPHSGCKQRGAADAVGGLYERMRERGELLVTPGRVTDVEMFLLELNRWLAGEQVFMLADRFRRAEVMTAMTKAGLNWPVEWRGQGHSHTADGSADVRGFQAAVMTGSLRFRKSLMMDAAVGNSSIVRDSAGNPKLQRLSSRGRIDALQAGVMSIAACYAAAGIPRRGVYHGLAG